MAVTESKDYNTMTMFLEICNSLYQRVGNKKEYIKDALRSHFVWNNSEYWEQYFYTILSKRYTDSFQGNFSGAMFSTSKQKEFVIAFIKETSMFHSNVSELIHRSNNVVSRRRSGRYVDFVGFRLYLLRAHRTRCRGFAQIHPNPRQDHKGLVLYTWT